MNKQSADAKSHMLVLDVDQEAESEFLAVVPNQRAIQYQVHSPSNRADSLSRYQLSFAENRVPDTKSVLALPGVQSAVVPPLAAARQHMRVVLNARSPHAEFFENQLLQLGTQYAGEIAVTSNPVVSDAIQSYMRATPDLVTAKKVNPPFVKSPADFQASGIVDDGPETAIDAKRIVIEAQCSVALGSANTALSKLIEQGYHVSSHSVQPTDEQDLELLTVVLHEGSDKKKSGHKAVREISNTMGVFSVRELSERSKIQYIQGIVHSTREDVESYLSGMRHALRDCGAHLRLRQSSADESSHVLTGHGPLAIVAGLAGDIQENGVWVKNAPVSLSSGKVAPSGGPAPRRNAIASAARRQDAGPSNDDELFRYHFGEEAYSEYRASLDAWLEQTIVEHTA